MIVLTGGGTGGHLSVVRALLEEAARRNLPCLYIGSLAGQDRAWFEGETRFAAKYFLPSSGVVNKAWPGRILALFRILGLAFRCRRIFKIHRVQALLSVGGYGAAPGAIAALLFGIPLFIHEQNARPGALNRLLRPFARVFFSSFASTRPHKNELLIPYPVAERFFASGRIRKGLGCVIFLGGSQGASFINSLALALAPSLAARGIKIIHQCGKKDLEKCQAEYERLGLLARGTAGGGAAKGPAGWGVAGGQSPTCKFFFSKKEREGQEQVDLFDFCQDLAAKISAADAALARAGAGSLFELCAAGLPSIFIPYPHAFANHQFFNATSLRERGLCELLPQDEASPEAVLGTLLNLDLEKISQGLITAAERGGAGRVLDELLLFADPTFS